MHLEVSVATEAGYEQALYGLSLSFKDRGIPFSEWWNEERFDSLAKRAESLAKMDGGHNKFLESIIVWLDIEAPRYWWQEFDTYRVGVTKQSESTMHTIRKRPLDLNDFEQLSITPSQLGAINNAINTGCADILIKAALPEGFLQRRQVCLSYKALRNIIIQRRNHKLPHWQQFIYEVLSQLQHPELLPGLEG